MLSNAFWEHVHNVVAILEPIYVVLRAVYNETYPSMRSLYVSMQLMKDAI
jgi:hypothetical protein